MPKLVPALLFGLVIVLGVAADDVRASCRPELAPNHPNSCQAERGRRARERALRVVEELGSRGLDYYSTTRSRLRPRSRSGASRLGDERGVDGRPRGGAALERDATAAEADRARQRALESEQANRTRRETQRLRAIDQRTRDLSGGRPFPRGTIGIGPQTR